MFSFPWGSYEPPKRYLAHPWQKQSRNRAAVLAHAVNPFNDHQMNDRRAQRLMKSLAKTFIEIVHARGLFGCLRDTAALDYWQGAVMALRFIDHNPLAEDVAKIGALEVAPRGYQAILEIDAAP